MQIDLTTFVLELLNFAVLVWVLTRFLFRPVMAVMDKRRADIEKAAQDARQTREQAERLRTEYAQRLAAWEQEKESARAGLAKELAAERAKGMEAIRQAVAQERRRQSSSEEKRLADWRLGAEYRALELGGQFAARLLERFSGPDLDARLVEVFLADLKSWPQEKVAPLVEAVRDAHGKISIASANTLPAVMKQSIEKALSEKLGVPCKAEYAVDVALLTGLRISIGTQVLQANVQDELAFFTQGASHAS